MTCWACGKSLIGDSIIGTGNGDTFTWQCGRCAQGLEPLPTFELTPVEIALEKAYEANR